MENQNEGVKITANKHYNPKRTPVRFVASLGGTHLIEKYHGCGNGIAFVKNGYVIDFFYEEDEKIKCPEGAKPLPVMMSCTEICFTQPNLID